MSHDLHKVAESFCRGTAVRPEDFIARLAGTKAGAVYVIYDQPQELQVGQKCKSGHKVSDVFFHFNGDKLELLRVNSDMNLVRMKIE